LGTVKDADHPQWYPDRLVCKMAGLQRGVAMWWVRQVSSFSAIIVACCLSSVLSGCGFGSETFESIEPDAAPSQPDFATDVAPIFDHYCTNCHSEQAPPWSSVFPFLDQQSEAERWACSSWNTIDLGRMPPGALDRLTSAELLTVRRWAASLGCPIP